MNIKSNSVRKDNKEFPPGPREIFPYSLAFKFISNPLPVLKEITNSYGDISHFKFGPKLHVYLINDPYIIENILVKHNQYFVKSPGLQLAKRVIGNGLLTNEGESHSKQRRIVQQAFTKDRIKMYGNIITEYCAEYTNANWKDGMIVDIHKEMTKLTLSIISKLLFGNNAIKLNEIDKISANITIIIEYINKLRLPFLRFIERLPIPSTLEYKEALKQLDNIIYSRIDLRRQKMPVKQEEKINETKTNDTQLDKYKKLQNYQNNFDILSALIDAGNNWIANNNEQLSFEKGEKLEKEIPKMNDKQIRDEVMTIFLAGHETTANALTWTLYLLACHPQAESKILTELEHICKVNNDNNKKIITVEDLSRLKYTQKVLMESMRLYPPSWAIGRQAIKDYIINEKYSLPSGSVVIMSQYLMHHDVRYFSDPEEFVPERWSVTFRASMPRFSYFPFGGGPRSCIGEPLAWAEGILVLANIINNWKVTLAEKDIANIKLHPLVTLRPKNGIIMKISKRSTFSTEE